MWSEREVSTGNEPGTSEIINAVNVMTPSESVRIGTLMIELRGGGDGRNTHHASWRLATATSYTNRATRIASPIGRTRPRNTSGGSGNSHSKIGRASCRERVKQP